jgi:23S rRNA pseudouridine1911/1915/1917 synthase
VTVSGDATRLDRFLLGQEAFAGIGRRRLAALLEAGRVRVNGRPARKGTIVRAGDSITLRAPAPEPMSETATAPQPTVLYENAELVAVDKPPGVPTTIGRKPGPSVAGGLLARYPEMATLDERGHAGLVHRLDTGTSGLLLAARTRETHATLRAAFARKRMVKDYLAVVAGRLVEPSIVSQPLARHPRSRGRMVPVAGARKGWSASTEVVPLQGDDALTLVRLRMRSGVTHQLRVHLAGLGHPILGDQRYGTNRRDQDASADAPSTWHYLHAWTIACADGELIPPIATPFPAHWRPLFAARAWSIPTD